MRLAGCLAIGGPFPDLARGVGNPNHIVITSNILADMDFLRGPSIDSRAAFNNCSAHTISMYGPYVPPLSVRLRGSALFAYMADYQELQLGGAVKM
jgi:hypothetical protein